MTELRTKAQNISRFDWIMCAMLGAVAPLLLVHCQNLWARQHFQFFPVAWAVFGYLVWQVNWTTTPHRWRRYLGYTCWVVAVLAIGTAVALFSPWLSHVALFFAALGWSFVRLGTKTWLTVILWCGLIGITIPLPGNADEGLIQSLQAVSTQSASSLLDAFRVPHLARGNILNVRGQELFVDEACSGVGSLYALAAVALMLIGLRESQRALFSLLLLCSVPFWAWLGNVLRLTVIASVLHHTGVDLTHGWQHTLLGLIVFAGSFLCLIGFTKFLDELLAPFSTAPKPSKESTRFNAMVRWPKSPKLKGQIAPPEPVPFVFGLLGTTALFGVLSLLPIAGVGPWKDAKWQLQSYTDVAIAETFTKQSLPESVEDFRRVNFRIERRGRGSQLGEHSTTWTLRKIASNPSDSLECIISLDFPFDEFHSLETCYTGTGHQIIRSQEVSRGINEVEFKTQIGGNAYLCFMEFKQDGSLVPRVSPLGMLQRGIVGIPTVYQLQIFCESIETLGEEDKKSLQALLQLAFKELLPLVQNIHQSST